MIKINVKFCGQNASFIIEIEKYNGNYDVTIYMTQGVRLPKYVGGESDVPKDRVADVAANLFSEAFPEIDSKPFYDAIVQNLKVKYGKIIISAEDY